MVCLQQIEADDETFVQFPKLREIGIVLDAMMLIEMLEKAVQPWDEGPLKLVCTKLPISECVDDARHLAAFMSQAGVHL